MTKKQRFGSTMKAAPFQMRSGNNPSPHKFFRGLGRAFRSLLFGPKRRRGGTGSTGPAQATRGMHTAYTASDIAKSERTITTPAGNVASTGKVPDPRKPQDSIS